MTTATTVDRVEAGLWVLQDHAKVEAPDRMFLAGVRVIEPQGSDDPWCGHVFDDDAKGGRKGTGGDIHPWRFFSPGSREHGLWHMALFTRVSDSRAATTDAKGRAITGGGPMVTSVVPVKDAKYGGAFEFMESPHRLPSWLPKPPIGFLMLAGAGTKEDSQENVLGYLDPRFVAANKNGPDEMGSHIIDLESGGYASMRRVALAQTHFRVAHFPAYENLGVKVGWVACLNLALTGQGFQAGLGAMYGPLQEMMKKKDQPTTPTERDPDPVVTEPDRPVEEGGGGGGGGDDGTGGNPTGDGGDGGDASPGGAVDPGAGADAPDPGSAGTTPDPAWDFVNRPPPYAGPWIPRS